MADPLFASVKDEIDEPYYEQNAQIKTYLSATYNEISTGKADDGKDDLSIEEELKLPLISSSEASRPIRNGFCFYRRGKCCLITLAILFILLLVGSLLTWFIFIPKYAESKVSDTKIVVNSVFMSGILSDGFSMDMNITMKNLPSLNVLIKSSTMDVLYNGSNIGSFLMPDIEVSDKSNQINLLVSTKFAINQGEMFSGFSKDLINLKSFTWDLSCHSLNLVVSLFGARIDIPAVKFSSSTTVDSFNGLKRLSVTKVDILDNINWSIDSSNPSNNSYLQGIELSIGFDIVNPAPISIDLGDVSFALYFDPNEDGHDPFNSGIPVGFMTVKNWTLLPGSASVIGRASLVNPETVPGLYLSDTIDINKHYEILSRFLTRFISGIPTQMGVTGWRSRDEFEALNAGTSISLPPAARVLWLETSLRSLKNVITYQYPGNPVVVKKLTMNEINFKVRHNIDMKPVISGAVEAFLSVPFSFDFKIINTLQVIDLYRCPILNDDSSCRLFGSVRSNWDSATSERSNASGLDEKSYFHKVSASLNRPVSDDVSINVNDENEYKNFIADLVRFPNVTFKVKGSCSARLYCGVGNRAEINGVQFEDWVTLDGMGIESSNDHSDILHFNQNMEVSGIDKGGDMIFRLPAYMKTIGRKGQVGLQVLSELEFQLIFFPQRSDTQNLIIGPGQLEGGDRDYDGEGVPVGVIRLNSLDLSNYGSCFSEIPDKLRNMTWVPPNGSKYCSIYTFGRFSMSSNETWAEYCLDRTSCIGRTFLSSYISGRSLRKSPTVISLRAVHSSSSDFEDALPFMRFNNIKLPGYQNDISHGLEQKNQKAPYQLVRRIIIQPGTSMLLGKLNCWLDFYNPFSVNLRYYYIHVETYLNDSIIGTLHVNFTDYDPFMFTKDYKFDGYPGRVHTSKSDPYGPHPGKACLVPGDCQIGPVDIATADELIRKNQTLGRDHWEKQRNLLPPMDPGVHRTQRMEVFFQVSSKTLLKFWQSIVGKDNISFNVTIKGQVYVGMGIRLSKERRNTTFDCPERKYPEGYRKDMNDDRDPYCYPEKPMEEAVQVVPLDFGQDTTELVFKKVGQPSPVLAL